MHKHIYYTIADAFKKISNDHVNAYASQASFFIILSFFPFLMMLLTIIQYTPINKDFLISWTTRVTPDVIDPLMEAISLELFENTGGATIISITVLLALWSASRGVLSIIRGLNAVFQVEDKRNYFLVRLLACLYTLVFLAGIILTLAILVFGQGIYRRIEENSTIVYNLLHVFMQQKWLISICVLTLFFLIIYKALPAKKMKFSSLLPGALVAALGWTVSSSAFSFYISYSPNFSYIYGSLTAFIIFMLWMYIGMYILLLGAEFNVYFRIKLQNFLLKTKEKLKQKKATK